MQIVVTNDDNLVRVNVSDSANLRIDDLGRWRTDNMIYAGVTESNSTRYQNVNPPSDHEKRWIYDSQNGTYTDTWVPKNVSRLEFIKNIQKNGGVTDTQLVQARNDTNLQAVWLKLQIAETIVGDDEETQKALDALVSTGYITNAGRQAIMDNWKKVPRSARNRDR